MSGENSSLVLDKWFATANGSGILDAAMLTDQMTYLPNDLLVKVDIASMANSLEARSPFLDHKVIEFAASLPAGMKMRGLQTKSLLEKSGGKAGAARSDLSPQNGFWRADRQMVSRRNEGLFDGGSSVRKVAQPRHHPA